MKRVVNKKGWKIKCFDCGSLIEKDEHYFRDKYGILCGECGAEAVHAVEFSQAEVNHIRQWQKAHPGQSYEQHLIDQANLRKYGEY